MSKNKKTAKKYADNGSKDSWNDRESRDMKRDRRRGKTNFDKAERSAGANDVSWYVSDSQLLLDSASLPWSNQVGQPITRKGIDRSIRDAVPGVACMHVEPVLGNADSPTDAVNVAAQSIYTYVRHANSGSKNYDPTDLMIYIMALDSIYYWLSFCKRAYATANMYAMENKYLPDLLFRAMGVDGASIRANLPAFRTRANNLILKVSTLVIPNTMPIFERHSFLFRDYYTEGESIKDQIYMFMPENYYVFQYDDNGAGMLKSKYFTYSPDMTADQMLDYLEEMIDAIYMEEDFGIMAGDILKAYGEGNVHKIGFIEDGIIARPVYNYSVLNQFKNAKVYPLSSGELDITQVMDPNYPVSPYIHQKPDMTKVPLGLRSYPTYYWYYSPFERTAGMDDEFWKLYYAFMNELAAPEIIVSSNAAVTPEETMVSTRLTAMPEFVQTTDGDGNAVLTLVDFHYGTEIPVYVDYLGFHYDADDLVPQIKTIRLAQNVLTNIVSGLDDITNPNYNLSSPWGMAALMSSFKFHPTHYFFNWASDDSGTKSIDWHTLPILDIDNYTLVTTEIMERLHSTAVLGEYRVPRLALS